jgi:hypothetical protein
MFTMRPPRFTSKLRPHAASPPPAIPNGCSVWRYRIQCVSLGNIQWNIEWTRLTTRDNIDEMEQTLCDEMAYIPFLPSITKYTGYPLLSTIKQEQGLSRTLHIWFCCFEYWSRSVSFEKEQDVWRWTNHNTYISRYYPKINQMEWQVEKGIRWLLSCF